jgi:hypothetical protein
MKNKIIKRSDIPRTTTFTKVSLPVLMALARDMSVRSLGKSTNLPRDQYILVEALYDGGLDWKREILILGAADNFKVRGDTGCMTTGRCTRDHTWRISDPKKAHDLALTLELIRGVRLKVRLASPIKPKSKS